MMEPTKSALVICQSLECGATPHVARVEADFFLVSFVDPQMTQISRISQMKSG